MNSLFKLMALNSVVEYDSFPSEIGDVVKQWAKEFHELGQSLVLYGSSPKRIFKPKSIFSPVAITDLDLMVCSSNEKDYNNATKLLNNVIQNSNVVSGHMESNALYYVQNGFFEGLKIKFSITIMLNPVQIYDDIKHAYKLILDPDGPILESNYIDRGLQDFSYEHNYLFTPNEAIKNIGSKSFMRTVMRLAKGDTFLNPTQAGLVFDEIFYLQSKKNMSKFVKDFMFSFRNHFSTDDKKAFQLMLKEAITLISQYEKNNSNKIEFENILCEEMRINYKWDDRDAFFKECSEILLSTDVYTLDMDFKELDVAWSTCSTEEGRGHLLESVKEGLKKSTINFKGIIISENSPFIHVVTEYCSKFAMERVNDDPEKIQIVLNDFDLNLLNEETVSKLAELSFSSPIVTKLGKDDVSVKLTRHIIKTEVPADSSVPTNCLNDRDVKCIYTVEKYSNLEFLRVIACESDGWVVSNPMEQERMTSFVDRNIQDLNSVFFFRDMVAVVEGLKTSNKKENSNRIKNFTGHLLDKIDSHLKNSPRILINGLSNLYYIETGKPLAIFMLNRKMTQNIKINCEMDFLPIQEKLNCVAQNENAKQLKKDYDDMKEYLSSMIVADKVSLKVSESYFMKNPYIYEIYIDKWCKSYDASSSKNQLRMKNQMENLIANLDADEHILASATMYFLSKMEMSSFSTESIKKVKSNLLKDKVSSEPQTKKLKRKNPVSKPSGTKDVSNPTLGRHYMYYCILIMGLLLLCDSYLYSEYPDKSFTKLIENKTSPLIFPSTPPIIPSKDDAIVALGEINKVIHLKKDTDISIILKNIDEVDLNFGDIIRTYPKIFGIMSQHMELYPDHPEAVLKLLELGYKFEDERSSKGLLPSHFALRFYSFDGFKKMVKANMPVDVELGGAPRKLNLVDCLYHVMFEPSPDFDKKKKFLNAMNIHESVFTRVALLKAIKGKKDIGYKKESNFIV
ncbi:hypothetical protein HOG98_03610 [bacterium]|jgi:hypothetical protein|nr:hypothetical protein [bacterium]